MTANAYVELGPTPTQEDCCQLGVNSIEEMKAECTRYRQMLETIFPIPEEMKHDVRFKLKYFPYEQSGYYEVVVTYDDADERQCDFVFNKVDADVPPTWNYKVS